MINTARVRPAFRHTSVDFGATLNLVGALITDLSVAFALPIAVATLHSEPPWPLLSAGAVCAVGGLLLQRTHKLVMISLSLLGQLGIVSVVVLFTKRYWRA